MILLLVPFNESIQVSIFNGYSYYVSTNFAGLIVNVIYFTFVMPFVILYKAQFGCIAAARPSNQPSFTTVTWC